MANVSITRNCVNGSSSGPFQARGIAMPKMPASVANTIMLSNVADMTTVLSGMAADGHAVTPDLVACASPYIRGHILRFGQYALDMGDVPPPLDPQPLPFEIA